MNMGITTGHSRNPPIMGGNRKSVLSASDPEALKFWQASEATGELIKMQVPGSHCTPTRLGSATKPQRKENKAGSWRFSCIPEPWRGGGSESPTPSPIPLCRVTLNRHRATGTPEALQATALGRGGEGSHCAKTRLLSNSSGLLTSGRCSDPSGGWALPPFPLPPPSPVLSGMQRLRS